MFLVFRVIQIVVFVSPVALCVCVSIFSFSFVSVYLVRDFDFEVTFSCILLEKWVRQSEKPSQRINLKRVNKNTTKRANSCFSYIYWIDHEFVRVEFVSIGVKSSGKKIKKWRTKRAVFYCVSYICICIGLKFSRSNIFCREANELWVVHRMPIFHTNFPESIGLNWNFVVEAIEISKTQRTRKHF